MTTVIFLKNVFVIANQILVSRTSGHNNKKSKYFVLDVDKILDKISRYSKMDLYIQK